MTQPTPSTAGPTDHLPLDVVMELATPLLREALDDMPPEQAAVTALGRRIRAEVERIYTAGRVEAFQAAAKMVEEIRLESTSSGSQRALEAYGLSIATALRITAKLAAAPSDQDHP
ncbi:hypothetical protein [Micromonospora profundi]|uniref:hypothetical protein n=1 Tax=Micromonospora profundi TaxID=1420889 RepID=UPI00365373C4